MRITGHFGWWAIALVVFGAGCGEAGESGAGNAAAPPATPPAAQPAGKAAPPTQPAAVAPGAQTDDGEWRKHINAQLEKLVTLELTDTALADVLQFLQDASGITIVIDPRIVERKPPPVSLNVTEMKLRNALYFILRPAGLGYDLRNGGLFVSDAQGLGDAGKNAPAPGVEADDGEWRKAINDRLEKLQTLDFQDQQLVDVMMFFRRITGINIVIDPKVIAKGPLPVSFRVEAMKFREVLDRVMKLTGLSYDLRHQAIFISDAEGLRDK